MEGGCHFTNVADLGGCAGGVCGRMNCVGEAGGGLRVEAGGGLRVDRQTCFLFEAFEGFLTRAEAGGDACAGVHRRARVGRGRSANLWLWAASHGRPSLSP